MSQSVEYETLVIGYFSIWSNSEEDAFIGAVLTVDAKGFPIEYRYTDEIKIDEAQKIFFGNSMYEYLITEVIGGKIVSDLERKPTFILVDDSKFLVLSQVIDLPVLFYDNEKEDFMGNEKDLKFFKDIPNAYLSLDFSEPFKRLEKGIEFSRDIS